MRSCVGSITLSVAEFSAGTSYENLPVTVVERAKVHILDTLGVTIAGSVSEAADVSCRHLVDQGLGSWGSVIIGSRLRAPPRFAAFANAVSAHAYNFDDTTPQIRVDRTGGIHASGSVLPAVLAVGEETGASGAEIISAYVTGVEISSRLNHAIAARHYEDGFHPTGTLNGFGAACAAAQLRGLNTEEMIAAVSLSASQASGVRRNFGTVAEIFHSGWAAENGVLAADLAGRGVMGANDALEGPTGFFYAAAGGSDKEEILGRLGCPWVFENPGIWIKPHPNGALTHPAAGCFLELVRKHNVLAKDVEQITVHTNERVWKTLQHHNPETGMQARFSMEFILAVLLLDRAAGLATFTDQTLARREVWELMAKVAYTPYIRGEVNYTNVTTMIEITLVDGRRIADRADHARGSRALPMEFEEVAEKFHLCATYGGCSDRTIDTLLAAVADLEHSRNTEKLVNSLILLR
ncbi:MAG: MmgE/PrpD family protein [Pseudomonadota bacterium]|nr:MmgE/PrpD family protein [Pseudomonadota bacterium]